MPRAKDLSLSPAASRSRVVSIRKNQGRPHVRRSREDIHHYALSPTTPEGKRVEWVSASENGRRKGTCVVQIRIVQADAYAVGDQREEKGQRALRSTVKMYALGKTKGLVSPE